MPQDPARKFNEDHYAILIGIERYPQLLGPDDKPLHLQGAANDVRAVREWLLDPKGGNLNPAHVFQSQRPPDAAPDAAIPGVADLENLVFDLDAIAQKNLDEGRGRQVGRRIYIYMSGHGFSPGRQRACLFTADARDRNLQNVHATGWLNWLQDAGYFREFVLWVDACMDRASFLMPRDLLAPPTPSFLPPLANFVAFAAQRPLKAVEVDIPEDESRKHGAFTWTLLEGLRGAAADANGRVTGRSLADWVRNAMVGRFGEKERADGNVAQEPDVIHEDAGMIFARGVLPPRMRVQLSFPPEAQGKEARIWSGAPPRIVHKLQVGAEAARADLPPGLYLVEVPDCGLRQGLEVLRPGAFEVRESGPPVQQCLGDEIFQVSVVPNDPAAEIFVIDGRFSLVDRGVGRLETPLPAGLFKVKMRVGNATRQDVALVDGDIRVPAVAGQAQAVATVLPLPGTTATHDAHQDARRNAILAANQLQLEPGEGALLCLARSFSSREHPVPPAHGPWRGMQVLDAQGRIVIDLEQKAPAQPGPDPVAFGVAALPAGCYFLRQPLDGQGEIEQSLVVCAGWRTEAYTLRRVATDSHATDPRPRSTVLMRPAGTPPGNGSDEEDRAAEIARQALAGERKVLTPDLEQLLMVTSGNPVAAIIGAHLMLVERERDAGRDLAMLDAVVRRLRGLLGTGHPDVEALALRCQDEALREVGELMGPPMFQRSWVQLTAAAATHPDLVSPEVWQRVHALSALPPFLVWNPLAEVKAAALRSMAEAVFGATVAAGGAPSPQMAPARRGGTRGRTRGTATPAVDMAAARERAARMGIPACAVDALREELGA